MTKPGTDIGVSEPAALTRTFSIAMATHNGAPHLGAQLASLSGQSRLPHELVVCDDASTDQTPELLEAFASGAPFPVRIHHNNHNVGCSQNFGQVAAMSRSDVVLLCDQDDEWSQHKVARVEDAFTQHPGAAVVMVDQEVCDQDMKPSGRTKLGNVRSSGVGITYYVSGCAAAIDRRWLAVMLPIPQGFAHDTWIIKPAHHLGLVRLIEEPLQRYRRHAHNASNDITSRRTRVSRLDRLRSQHDSAAVDGWRAECRDNALIANRLEERREVLEAAGWIERLEPALVALRERSSALQARSQAVGRGSRATRPLRVLGLLAGGGYEPFQGWRSAAVDLVR